VKSKIADPRWRVKCRHLTSYEVIINKNVIILSGTAQGVGLGEGYSLPLFRLIKSLFFYFSKPGLSFTKKYITLLYVNYEDVLGNAASLFLFLLSVVLGSLVLDAIGLVEYEVEISPLDKLEWGFADRIFFIRAVYCSKLISQTEN